MTVIYREIIDTSIAMLPESERDTVRDFFLRHADQLKPVFFRHQSCPPPKSGEKPDALLLPLRPHYPILNLKEFYTRALLEFVAIPREYADRWLLARSFSFFLDGNPVFDTLYLPKSDGGISYQPNSLQRPNLSAFRVADSFTSFYQNLCDRDVGKVVISENCFSEENIVLPFQSED